MQIPQQILQLSSIPPWRRYLYGSAILLVLGYLAWAKWGARPQTPQQGFIVAKPAVKADKVPGPTVTLRVVPKAAVRRKYPNAVIPDPVEVVDTADIPSAPNGATTITTVDPTSGESSTQVQLKEPPWFALKRDLAYGVGAGIGTQGNTLAGRVRLDVARIKHVTVSPEIEGNYAAGRKEPFEGRFMVFFEYRP